MKRRNVFALIIMLLFAAVAMDAGITMQPVPVSAAKRWTDGADQSIYNNPNKKEKNIDLGDVDDKKVAGKSSKGLGGLLAGLLNGISDWFDIFFESTGMTLKNVIYGRVGGGGVILHFNGEAYRTSLFTFETVPGNPYGIVSFAIYAVLCVLSLVLVPIVAGGKFVGAIWRTNTEAAKKTGGEAFKNTMFFFMLLLGMPMIMDLMFYLRDVFLYVISYQGTQLLGVSAGADLCGVFDTLAEDSPKALMLSVIRLASKFITLYFGFTYIGVVMGCIVSVVTFPMVGISMIMTPRILSQWVKTFVSFLSVPVVDSILILVVLFMSVFGGSMIISVIQLLLLYMLIPARSEIRSLLGVSSGFRMELAGLGAYAAAVGLAGAAVGGATSVIRGGRDVKNMNRMGDMYDDIAAEQKKNGGEGGNDKNGTSGGMINDPDDPIDGGGGAGVVNDYGSASSSAATETLSGAAAHMETGTGAASSLNGNREGTQSAAGKHADDKVRTAGGNYVPNSILRKYANTGNFQDGMFNMLTAEQKAQLYHKKAEQKALGTLMGALGGVAGAGVGLAAMTASGSGFCGLGPATVARAGRAGAALASGAVEGMGIGLKRNAEAEDNLFMQEGYPLLEQTSATFGEEDLAAANAFREANPSFDQQLASMESFPDIEGFDEMFDQCGSEFSDVIGTEKPANLQTEGNAVWQDTPEDRYQYFRTQKAPEFLSKAFEGKVNGMTPLSDSKQNEMAKNLLNDAFSRTVNGSSYGGLSEDMLALQGYSFQNGFTRVSPDSDSVRSLARNRFMAQNPGISSVVNNLADVDSNPAFQDAFDSCAGEWGNIVGSEKPIELQHGGEQVWRDTPEDRYQYFRTQKAEPVLKESFGSALDVMSPLPNSRSNALAKKAVLDEYAESISGENYAALKRDNLELLGYDFEHGFQRAGQNKYSADDTSIII